MNASILLILSGEDKEFQDWDISRITELVVYHEADSTINKEM